MGFDEVREFDYGQVSGVVTITWLREDYAWIGTRLIRSAGKSIVQQAIRFRDTEWDFTGNLRLVDGEWTFESDTVHVRKLGVDSFAPVPAPRTYAEKIREAIRKVVVEAFTPETARKAGRMAAEQNYAACMEVRHSLMRQLAVADEALAAAAKRRRMFA